MTSHGRERGHGTRRRFEPCRALLATALWLAPSAWGLAAEHQTRGRLLYDTHCIACHSTQLHWRDQRAAQDWASLAAQVRAWQARANLGWSEDDIQAVAGHLNDTVYRFARPPDSRPLAARRSTALR